MMGQSNIGPMTASPKLAHSGNVATNL
jgi:hypothetical protein